MSNDNDIEEELKHDVAKPIEIEELDLYSVDIKDIEGIGVTTARKLKDAGIHEVVELAVQNPFDLAESINCSQETARTYILSSQKLLRDYKLLDKEFMTGTEVLNKRKKLLRCTTSSKVLDNFFKGGIETNSIYELFGEFGSGKTQLCHTLAVNAQLPVEQGGFNSSVIYFDTEGTFRAERIEEIALAKGLDVTQILDHIHVSNIYNSAQLELYIDNLASYIRKYNNPKLIIVDSLTSHHRAEFLGRGTLSDRQQRLGNISHKLVKVSEIYGIAIVVTNQVQANPDIYGTPIKPIGGHTLGHSMTYRIFLKKSKHDKIATMIDSPYHPYGEVKFTVDTIGVKDAEE